jgi:hypothetical protein
MNTYKQKKRKYRPPAINQEQQLLLDELMDLIRRQNIEVRIEPGRFNGGFCLVDNKKIFFINKDYPVDQNIDIVVQYLKTVELENVFLSPKLRSILEESEINF